MAIEADKDTARDLQEQRTTASKPCKTSDFISPDLLSDSADWACKQILRTLCQTYRLNLAIWLHLWKAEFHLFHICQPFNKAKRQTDLQNKDNKLSQSGQAEIHVPTITPH